VAWRCCGAATDNHVWWSGLVKLAKVRQDHSLPKAIDMAQEAGRKYVTIASSVLAGK
jgi:hypothetical protein